MADHKKALTIVVNGQPVEIEANENAPLRSLVGRALELSGNVGQPPENWELRDAEGILLDLDKKIKEFSFPEVVKLFLNLKAGIGG